MRSPVIAVLLLALSCASARAGSTIDEAADRLLARFPDARVLVLGELHGTAESPALAAAVTRRLLLQHPVTVALEIHREEQPAIEAWMTSDGSSEARATLFATPFWQVARDRSDGRRSIAKLDLLDQLRVMKAQFPALDVIAFDTRRAPDKRAETHLAESLRAIAARRADDRMVVLTGNYHAKRRAPPHVRVDGGTMQPPQPMLAYLPVAPEWVSVNVSARSGQFWACNPSCGIKAVRVPTGRVDIVDAVELLDASSDYDATLLLPRFTASEPAQ